VNAIGSSRAMTTEYVFAISRHIAPEVCWNLYPPRKQRAQGRPGARCTRGLACKSHNKKRTRAYRFSGGIPAFPAQWFTAYIALSSVSSRLLGRRSLPLDSLRSRLVHLDRGLSAVKFVHRGRDHCLENHRARLVHQRLGTLQFAASGDLLIARS